jgi:hypothetical protein
MILLLVVDDYELLNLLLLDEIDETPISEEKSHIDEVEVDDFVKYDVIDELEDDEVVQKVDELDILQTELDNDTTEVNDVFEVLEVDEVETQVVEALILGQIDDFERVSVTTQLVVQVI